MSWEDRLKKTITLTSPDNDFFEAKWRGGTRGLIKKIGLFNYPGVDGTVSQDQGSESFTYPLTLYFDGPDNDIETERFIQSAFQRGLWEIDHPVKGKVLLQLLDATEAIEPIDSGNITVVTTNWIEPITDEVISSSAQLENEIEAFVFDANSLAIVQFAQMIQDTFAKVAAVKAAIQKVVAIVKKVTSTIGSIITGISSTMNAIQRGIADTLNAVILEPLKLAAQMQELLQLPGLIITDFQTRITMYQDIANEIFGLTPDSDNVSNESFNTVLVQELSLSAIIAITPSVGATSPYTVRTETLQAMTTISELFTLVTTQLDNSQKNFEDVFIDDQYFSQSQTYVIAMRITALSNQLLIKKTFDLSIQKTILLKEGKTPFQISIEEYGQENIEDNYDLFLKSNNLYGDDILFLHAGREVVIYG